MTLPGAPAIYYGDEIGMEGENDPDCRRTMPWNTRRWNIEIFEYYKQMIRMRKKHPPLVMGDLRILLKDSEKGVCAFERVYGSDRVVVCVNNSGKEQTVSLDEDGEFSELLTGEKHESYEGVIRLTISAKSGLILASR
jgi:glycosidase